MKDEADVVAEIQQFIENDDVAGKNVANEHSSSVPKQKNTNSIPSNPIEALATSHGWDPNGKKNAEEYVRYALEQLPERGEALKKQSEELKELKIVAKELAAHLKKQEKMEMDKQKQQLEAQKRQAVTNGDVELFEQLEKQEKAINSSEPPLAVVQFKERNRQWLEGTEFEDFQIQDFAMQRDSLLAKRNLPVEEHMKVLEEHIRRQFPAYFKSDDRGLDIQTVESSSSNVVTKSKKTFSFNDLSDEQKTVARFLERQGTMTKADYIKQLIDAGELK